VVPFLGSFFFLVFLYVIAINAPPITNKPKPSNIVTSGVTISFYRKCVNTNSTIMTAVRPKPQRIDGFRVCTSICSVPYKSLVYSGSTSTGIFGAGSTTTGVATCGATTSSIATFFARGLRGFGVDVVFVAFFALAIIPVS
jgi:hypothetical protein